MTLSNRITELVQACFAGIWVNTLEPDEAAAELSAMCREAQWQFANWDIERGLRGMGGDVDASDPLSVVRAIAAAGDGETPMITVLHHFHRFMASAEMVQALVHAIDVGKRQRSFAVVLAPVVDLPPELEKLFVVVDHDRPDRGQLREIAASLAGEDGELPDGNELESLIDAASGLTRYEAEGAFSLSLVREGRLTPAAVWELKTQTLAKSGLLTLYRGGETFDSLGGLSAMKAFTRRALRQRSECDRSVRPRGVMLLSPPGCGKSAFCKSLGDEVGRPVLMLDVGNLLGSLVGQSEERTRRALAIVDAMAPCVLMIDEVEKAFAGSTSGSSTDGGVSSRMFGTFLTWLNDHDSDVFVVCTANDVSKLPPEFARAERFDAVFFVDLPGRDQKDAIWDLYRDQFNLADQSDLPDDENWTGAEIKACCRLAALLDVPIRQAATNIVPVAVTSSESVDRLRGWASGRCLSAESSGVYRREPPTAPLSRRRVSTTPSQN